MKRTMLIAPLLIGAAALTVQAKDAREPVELPPPTQAHMITDMRDHLVAFETIIRQHAEGQYDAAAETVESRLGMSALKSCVADRPHRYCLFSRWRPLERLLDLPPIARRSGCPVRLLGWRRYLGCEYRPRWRGASAGVGGSARRVLEIDLRGCTDRPVCGAWARARPCRVSDLG
jgi:hypothetical protein